MRLAILALVTALVAACAVDPDPRSVPERNAAAEADANRGIVCGNETPDGSDFSRRVCTTPAQRENQRDAQRKDPDSASDIERKPTL